MDGNRFDDLVRKLAEPHSRRRALKTLAGGVAAAVVSVVKPDNTEASQTCRSTGVVCRKNSDCCTNVCGAPDFTGRRKCKCNTAGECPAPQNSCFTSTCANGLCGTTTACTPGQVCSNGACCTPQTDNVTCLNKCGPQVNNCGQSVDCGPCCLAGGSGCSANSSCCSGYCILGTCQGTPSGNGSVCDETADCVSGLVCCASTCRQCCQSSDCPGTDTECQTRTCISNICGFSNTAAGVETTAQTAGDCKKNVCDGAGGTTTENDDTDVPTSTGECTTGKCTSGVPSQTPVTLGQECSTGFCNFQGVCTECVFNTNCGTGEICCSGACQISNDESCGCEELACGVGEICHDNDECIDSLYNNEHCGSEFNACSDTECCNGECVDLQSSDQHCGFCDSPCGVGETCCSGVCCSSPNFEGSICICGDECSPTCQFNETCCNGSCCESPIIEGSVCFCS